MHLAQEAYSFVVLSSYSWNTCTHSHAGDLLYLCDYASRHNLCCCLLYRMISDSVQFKLIVGRNEKQNKNK